MFKEYYQEMIQDNIKLYYNYLGIIKKEYPKWEGWKIISEYKQNGIDIKEIDDQRLTTLVQNFYYLQYLKSEINM